MKWGRFLAFACGVAILAALALLLTGHGFLIGETLSGNKLGCRYLTVRGVVTKEFNFGHVNFGRDECPFLDR